MKRIRLSSILYIILGIICVVYNFYFIKNIYYSPNLKYYYLYYDIYCLVTIPILFFSITGFVVIVIRDIFSIKLSKSKKRIFRFISIILILIYVGFLIFTFISKEILNTNIISIYNMLFIIFGLIFSLGAHKE